MHRKVPVMVILIHPIEFLIGTTLDPLSCPLCSPPPRNDKEGIPQISNSSGYGHGHGGEKRGSARHPAPGELSGEL